MPAVVQTPPSCFRVKQSSQSPPLFQTRFSFSSSDNFQSFSFCPRDQEVLKFLIHLVRHIELMLQVCHSDRLLLVLCGLRRLLQRCTTPTKSLARYDNVLQLDPFFFPNRSGIKVFGFTNRIRNLVSTILRRALNSWCTAWCPADTRCSCSCSSWIACFTDMATLRSCASKQKLHYHANV